MEYLYLFLSFILFCSAITFIDASKMNDLYKLLPTLRFESSSYVVNGNLLVYGYINDNEQEWEDLIGQFNKEYYIFIWYYPRNCFRIERNELSTISLFNFFSPYVWYVRLKYIKWCKKNVLNKFIDIYHKETNEVL